MYGRPPRPTFMFEGLGRSSDEKVFNTLRNAMAELGVDCEADEENRHILFTVQGDDLEIGFQAAVIEGCILLSAVLAVTVAGAVAAVELRLARVGELGGVAHRQARDLVYGAVEKDGAVVGLLEIDHALPALP